MSSSSVVVVKKNVKNKRRRRRKTYRRKTISRTSNGKKRKIKRRKHLITVNKTDTQLRIANVFKSYQSMPKVIEKRIVDNKRLDSGIRVFKPIQPTLDSECEEPSIRKREETTKPSTSSSNLLMS
jgi:hypothetical protein